MSNAEFAGQVALIVGVARPPGIGRSTAIRLARRGASCFCVDVVAPPDVSPVHTGLARQEMFDAVLAEVTAAAADGGGAVAGLRLGADAPIDAEAVVAAAVERFGRLDICCALSGATGAEVGDGPLLNLTDGSWRACLEWNLTAPLELAVAAIRSMMAHGRAGSVVLLSSAAARAAAPGAAALGAARAGLGLAVEALAAEAGPYGVRCNAVNPLGVGPTEAFPNPGLVALAQAQGGSLEAWTASRIPLARMQDPDETAAVIEFLCSADASFVTGSIVPVTGGGR